jgi:hypothetical protein
MEKTTKVKLSYIGFVAIGTIGASIAVAVLAVAIGLFSRLVVFGYNLF